MRKFWRAALSNPDFCSMTLVTIVFCSGMLFGWLTILL